MKMTVQTIVLVFLLAAQLAVPGFMIHQKEHVLKKGQLLRLQCAPVDPYDVFRGRYVSLSFEEARIEWPEGLLYRGQRKELYVSFTVDKVGIARVADISPEEPAEGLWLKLPVQRFYNENLHIDFPFRRYYLDEKLAPAAESAYNKLRRVGALENSKTWVTVRVLNGKGVLEELYLDGLPVREYLDREAAKKTNP